MSPEYFDASPPQAASERTAAARTSDRAEGNDEAR